MAVVRHLGPGGVTPAQRHARTVFRFVVEGEGVWIDATGDRYAVSRGDLLIRPGGQCSTQDGPLTWIDGLTVEPTVAPEAAVSASERLWGRPGLAPVGAAPWVSPLVVYRWRHTDAALTTQLEAEAAGHPGVVGPGHAVVRFTDPATGRDALPTVRTEMHRLRPGARAGTSGCAGSVLWQVFDGDGSVTVGSERHDVARGDLFAVPPGVPVTFCTDRGLDAFRFSDEPVEPPLLALRCYQPECTHEGPIGAVWGDGNGQWGADAAGRPGPSRHPRALDAARWVRTHHDVRHHSESRWTVAHLDVASAADVAAAHALTTG
ncbi:MAG: cupin domain-containing protein [Pseudonocardia sp.]|nr:cupin domain-containing protein [Pseudonocardia sp.]